MGFRITISPLDSASGTTSWANVPSSRRTMRSMLRQGYGSLQTFLDEQVLRSVTCLAMGDLWGPEALAEEANYHETYGFYLTRPVIELLREQGAEDIPVFGGGIVPDEDIPGLKQAGVLEVFTPGATTDEIVKWVRTHIRSRRA